MLAELSEFETANGTHVFVGGLAFKGEALRRATGERFLAPDAQQAAAAPAKPLHR